MPDPINVHLSSREDAEELAAKLRSPEAALESVGAVIVAQARQAFEEQRLGDVIWKERYPAMREPFINVAPVVQKAGEGRTPTTDDFRRRPALGGAGSELAASIAFNVQGNAVEIGSSRPDLNPGLFQFGGIGRISITDTTRATLREWLFTEKGTEIKRKVAGTTRHQTFDGADDFRPGSERTRNEYAPKLAFVFDKGRTELVQGAYPRPFVGFGDVTFDRIQAKFAEWLGGTVGA